MAQGLTKLNTVTVTQATGSNLHTVVDSGTITTVSAVTAISNALPAGTNAIGKLASNDGVDIGDVTINNAGGASAVNVQDGGNSITVDNGGTFAVQSTIAAGATNIAKAEDVASADADVGVPALAVRKGTPANTSGTDGDYEFLQMSAGRLWASATIDAALPAGTNLLGKVGIDQTTPGTTNNVNVGTVGSTAVNAFPAGFQRTTDEPKQIFYDPFDGALDTTNLWTTPTVGNSAVLASNTAGVMSMGTGTTASGWSKLTSQASFKPTIPAWLGYSFAIAIPDLAAPTANSLRYWGSGTIATTPTTAAPITDGAGFELGTTGKMFAVVYSGGTRTAIQDLSAATGNATQPTDASYHRYVIYYRTDKIYFYIDGLASTNLVATSNFQQPQVQTLPESFVAVGGSTPPVSNSQIQCTGAVVWDTGKNSSQLSDGTYPWRKATIGATGALSNNLAQIAGTTTDTNSGLKSAGTLRVVLATDQPALTNKLLVTPDSVALPANQSVNVSQINGVTPLMGNGVTGTGSARVTLVSDGTAISTTGFMSVKVDQTTVGTTNAISLAQLGANTVSTGNGASGTGVLRVAQVNDGTGVIATVSAVTAITNALPAGTNAIGKLAANSGVDIGDIDVTSVIAGTGATNLGKAEDAAHTTGDTGVMALAVRNDGGSVLAGTDGDYVPLTTDNLGNLRSLSHDTATNGNLTGTGSVTLSTLSSATSVGIQITGTWVATVQFEGSVDGTNYFSLNANPYLGASSVATSTTANGQWLINTAGLVSVRARCSAFTSGTITIYLRAAVGFGTPALNVDTVGVLNTYAVGGGGVKLQQGASGDGYALNVGGGTAHDAVDAGNPVKIGGYAKATAPTAVSADADRVNAWLDLNGRQIVSDNAFTTTIDLTATSPNTATTTAQTAVTGLGYYRSMSIYASIQGATGGTLDIYIQYSPDSGTTWVDYAHFAQLAAGAAAIKRVWNVAKYAQQTTLATVGTGTSPALAASTIIGGDWGDRLRVVFVAGASTSAGASQTIKLILTS